LTFINEHNTNTNETMCNVAQHYKWLPPGQDIGNAYGLVGLTLTVARSGIGNTTCYVAPQVTMPFRERELLFIYK